METHIMPMDDSREHDPSERCACCPDVMTEGNQTIVIHNSFLRIELISELLDGAAKNVN